MRRPPSFDHDRAGADRRPVSAAIREAAADWVARRDAGLSAREEIDYAAWIEADPAHRTAVERLDFAWRILDRPLTTGTADAVLGELAARARRRRRHRALAIRVATLPLLVGAVLGWRALRPASDLSSPVAVSAAVLLPSIKSLADGSVTELRDGAEIAVEFTATQRRVVLRRGEAYFKVAKNATRPFVVAAGGVEVQAVGTAFSVQLEDTSLEVLVTEGTVAVAVEPGSPAPEGPAAPQPHLITAGDGAVLEVAPEGRRRRLSALSKVDIQSKLAWRGPRLEFSAARLVEAVALMNRHAPVKLVIEDPQLANLRVSGIFGAANTDAFVRVLESSFNAQSERRSEHEIILRGRR